MKRRFCLAIIQSDYNLIVKEYLEQGYVVDPELKVIRLDNATVWPLIQYESEEEKPKLETKHGEFDDVTDVVDSAHAEVKDWVAKGYVVNAIYAKSTILIKRR